jgi:hypothetical protein
MVRNAIAVLRLQAVDNSKDPDSRLSSVDFAVGLKVRQWGAARQVSCLGTTVGRVVRPMTPVRAVHGRRRPTISVPSPRSFSAAQCLKRQRVRFSLAARHDGGRGLV